MGHPKPRYSADDSPKRIWTQATFTHRTQVKAKNASISMDNPQRISIPSAVGIQQGKQPPWIGYRTQPC